MATPVHSVQSVAVIGAGLIGLSCALELADRDIAVTLYEKSWPPRGASWAAAGMLAPAFEAVGVSGSHSELYDLCTASARLWPEWAERLERRTGLSSGYHPGPSLAVALDQVEADHLAAVERTLAGARAAPSNCTDALSETEPTLSDKVVSGLLLPSDGQADNRLTLEALIEAVQSHPNIKIHVGSAPLKRLGDGLDHAGHDRTLLTAGWQTGSVFVDDAGRARDVRAFDPVLRQIEPIAGQMLSVAPIEKGPRMTIRAGHIYIVPKTDRIVIGATSEPGRVLETPEADQIAALRAKAIEICPVLEEAPVLESWAGIRPGLASHAPLIGETAMPGVYVAAGHYRNGILLAPITAQIIGDLIQTGETTALAAEFAPGTLAQERV